MSWKESAKRTIYGDRIYLGVYNNPGAEDEEKKDQIWFRPRKFSIEAQDAIAEEAYKLRNDLGPDVIAVVKKREDLMRRLNEATQKAREEAGDPELTLENEQVLQLLDADELASLMHGIKPSKRMGLIVAELTYGIGDHNFIDENTGKRYESTEQLARDIVDISNGFDPDDLAARMISAIEELNRPLLKTLGGASGMRASTSTTKSNSRKSQTTTQTEETHASSSESGVPGSSSA